MQSSALMKYVKQIICLAGPREVTEKMMNRKKGERIERLNRERGPWTSESLEQNQILTMKINH